MIRTGILCLFFSVFQTAYAQSGFITGWRADRIENEVRLRLVITAGNTCDGIDLLRSTDAVNYRVIGNIAGVCGNASVDTDYEFIDDRPEPNQINYYRARLTNLGLSDVVSVFMLVRDPSGHLLFPLPAVDYCRIVFREPIGIPVDAQLLSSGGQLLRSYRLSGDFADLDLSGLSSGSYFLKTADESEAPFINEKIVILR